MTCGRAPARAVRSTFRVTVRSTIDSRGRFWPTPKEARCDSKGKVSKSGEHWLAEVPALDAMTQGRSREGAYAMVKDLVETMADSRRFVVTVHRLPADRFEISANDVKVLVALLLRRQREKAGPYVGASCGEASPEISQRLCPIRARGCGSDDRETGRTARRGRAGEGVHLAAGELSARAESGVTANVGLIARLREVVRSRPRLRRHAWRLDGTERFSGRPLSLLCTANSQTRNYLAIRSR